MAEPEAQRIEVLVREALNRAGEDRAKFLAEACRGDAVLRAKIEQQLAESDVSGKFYKTLGENDPTATLPPAGGSPTASGRIGRYHIRREIASGGMGTVYEAVQEQPHRTVALKVMRRGVASRSALRRFEYESQILARLRHPHIAQVYEAGTHDDGSGGVPFFAMEYIPSAKTLTEYVTDKKLDTRRRLALFIKVCDAVHHGHQKGIIHRDLKPSNILVDFEGEPKIIDFGVARATDSDMALTTLQTDVGQLIGTLQYMSPEQCDADPHNLDSRSDVYALGIVLYELLCGELPYNISGVPVIEAARVIREQAPTRLSSTNRTLRGDLETIALKALDKDRTRRYQSASDLAADIDRYLGDQPIVARPPSAIYQLRKFARRNKLLVGSVAALIVVLSAATTVSTYFWRDAVAAARRSDAAAQRSDAANLFSLGQLQENRTEALAYLLASLELADERETRHLILKRLWEGPTEFRFGPAYSYNTIDFSPDGRWLAIENETNDRDQWAGGWLWPSDGNGPTKLEELGAGQEIRIGPNSDIIVQSTGADRRGIGIWSIPEGHLLRGDMNFEGMTSFNLPRDGQRILTSTALPVGELLVQSWPIDGGEPDVLARVSISDEWEAVWCKADPTGTRFAWAVGRNVFVASLGGDHELFEPSAPLEHDYPVGGIAFDSRGTRLATADNTGDTKIWSVTSDPPAFVNTIRLNGWYGLRFDGSGSLLAAWGRVARLDGPPDAWPLPLSEDGMSVAFHPNSRWAATGGDEYTAEAATRGDEHTTEASLWPLARLYPYFLGHPAVLGLAFAPDGSWIASAGSVGSCVRIWPMHVESGERSKVLYVDETAGFPSRVVADPNGRFVAACFVGPVRILPLDGGPVRELEGFTDTIWALAISPDGRLIAAGSGNYKPEEAVIRIWDLETGDVEILEVGDGKLIDALEFTPDGALLASSAGAVRLWDVEQGTPETLADIPVSVGIHSTGAPFDLAPDGNRLLAVFEERLFVHDLDANWGVVSSRELSSHGAEVVTAIFDQTGRTVISTDAHGTIRVGPVSGDEPHLLLGQSGPIGALAVSPDNKWIATGGENNGSFILWPMPDEDARPFHLLPRRELIARLKSLTNLRVVRNEDTFSGWKLDVGPFPGWDHTPPTW